MSGLSLRRRLSAAVRTLADLIDEEIAPLDFGPRTIDPQVAAIRYGDLVKIVDDFEDGTRITVEGVAVQYEADNYAPAWRFSDMDLVLHVENQAEDLVRRRVEIVEHAGSQS